MWWALGYIVCALLLTAGAVVFVWFMIAEEPMWDEIMLVEQERKDGLRDNE